MDPVQYKKAHPLVHIMVMSNVGNRLLYFLRICGNKGMGTARPFSFFIPG